MSEHQYASFSPIGTSGAGLVSYDEVTRRQFQADPMERRTMLQVAADSFLNGDPGDGRAALRVLIKATCGYPALAQATGIPPKSLMRMLGETGNPTSDNLFKIIRALAAQESMSFAIDIADPIPPWVEPPDEDEGVSEGAGGIDGREAAA